MDVASIAAAFIAQQVAQVQTAAAAKILRMNTDAGNDAAKLLQSAQQNFNRLVNVATGIGGNLDVTV
jgi:cell division septum initiation protein DivIVA